MTHFRRILFITVLLVTCVGCDQITKVAARNYLSSSPPIILTGIAFTGMLAVLVVHRSLRPNDLKGFSLLISGGLGNLIDRMLHHGAVIDFMNIGVGSLRTGIFNIADLAIMVGSGLLIFDGFRKRRWRY